MATLIDRAKPKVKERGNLRGSGNRIGELLGNVRGLGQNCLIDNQAKMNDKLYTKKQSNFQMRASSYKFKYRLLKIVLCFNILMPMQSPTPS